MNAQEIERLLREHGRTSYGYGSWLLGQLYGSDAVAISGLGVVTLVDQFGGEGLGDEAWFVFELDGRMFRINGYHSSYYGTYYDGDVHEVKPQIVERVEYERVSF